MLQTYEISKIITNLHKLGVRRHVIGTHTDQPTEPHTLLLDFLASLFSFSVFQDQHFIHGSEFCKKTCHANPVQLNLSFNIATFSETDGFANVVFIL
jgi:hypothetical protein